ncbi:MAG: AAA family ATPase [Bacteroidales bacterium]|nr:AAA family ATPase [Bacteroidales bacterium]
MEYTSQQKQALESIEQFLKSKNSIFVLKGYAGTGKTTLVSPIIKIAEETGRNCQLMALTGRAAKILGEKTGCSASTIHKSIYEFSSAKITTGNENIESKVMFRFSLRSMDGHNDIGLKQDPESTLLIVDEASMIGANKQTESMYVFGSGFLLRDLIKYANLSRGGKILFIGDPCQLPPIGDEESPALDTELLEEYYGGVESFELTEVIRQDMNSIIKRNSLKLRNLINSNSGKSLVLERRKGEVEDINYTEIPDRFCELTPSPSLKGPVVICWSNRQAAHYNSRIRNIYFPNNDGTIRVGDRLMVVTNNYMLGGRHILNGEPCQVVKVSKKVETLTGPYYEGKSEGKNRYISVNLNFRNVSLLFEDGIVVKTKIMDNLIGSEEANLSYREQCALQANFNERHKDLKRGSREYIEAAMHDPYLNAVRVKYGYSITCHKAQGGEWDTVFVDFRGRVGLNVECLRWSYTALTRARKTIYGYQLHDRSLRP